jgi:hypothetical protein
VLLSLVGCAAPSPKTPPAPASSATSTSFGPTAVSLGAGQSATITIAAAGLSPGNTGAQFGVEHNTANTTISNPQCVGIFAGSDANQATQATGDLLACTSAAGIASGTSGDVMSFTLTNTGGAAETISFNTAMTIYLTSAYASESPGGLNTLTVTNPGSP